MSETLIVCAGNPQTGEKVTDEDIRELHELLKKDCIDAILADARVSSATYVINYDVGRGAE